jgi:hypothetical protein
VHRIAAQLNRVLICINSLSNDGRWENNDHRDQNVSRVCKESLFSKENVQNLSPICIVRPPVEHRCAAEVASKTLTLVEA